MTVFAELPIEVNAESIVESVHEDMEARFPGWEPAAGNAETFLIRAIVYRLIVPLAELAADAGAEIFHQFGAQIMALPPIEAQPATVTSTWTMIDNQGYTIPADTQVDVATAGDTAVGFRVMEEVQVLAGATTTGAGEVALEAVEPGVDGNGLSGTGSLVDALAYVDDPIALVGTSSGGTDAEDPLVYLGRLAATIQTLGPHPIIARDVEILARNIAGVSRATALDMFDPAVDDPENTATWDSERHCSVAVHDADGLACSAPVKAAVLADLDAKREVNFVFHVLDPTYSTIKVNFEVVVMEGHDQATVEAGVIAALTAYLSPANWGRGDQLDPTEWENETIVRYQDLVTVVNNQQGVDHYTTLTVAKGAAALGTADVTLTGPAALPLPGVIQVEP